MPGFIFYSCNICFVGRIAKNEAIAPAVLHVPALYSSIFLILIQTLVTFIYNIDSKSNLIPNETAGNGYDYYIGDGAADIGTMKYNSEAEKYNDGGNYISSLKPGESIQVNMAWIVNEEDIENMYLNFSGNEYDFTECLLDTGVVDIRN